MLWVSTLCCGLALCAEVWHPVLWVSTLCFGLALCAFSEHNLLCCLFCSHLLEFFKQVFLNSISYEGTFLQLRRQGAVILTDAKPLGMSAYVIFFASSGIVLQLLRYLLQSPYDLQGLQAKACKPKMQLVHANNFFEF